MLIPANPNTRKAPVEPAKPNFDWREEIFRLAYLLDRMTPDYGNPERFYLQRSALVRELIGLADGRGHDCSGTAAPMPLARP
jgi:hypothetical protein